MDQSQRRASIRAIRQRHGLTAQQIAETAGVPLRVEYLMEIGGHVSKNDAKKVMQALSALTGDRSKFSDIRITLE